MRRNLLMAPGSRLELFRLALHERREPDAYYEALAQRTIDALPVQYVGRTVLDLGCGTGHDGARLRRAGAKVISLDVELTLAEAARDRGVPAVCASAFNLPLPDHSVDGVYCSNVLEHVPAIPPLLDEVARVLRPDGWVWFSWTNWFSPWGGPHMIPLHLLGPRLGPAVWVRLFGPPPKNVPGIGLFPTYVGRTIHMIENNEALDLRDAYPRYYPSQRWIVRVPLLREFLTWNCVIIASRRRGPSPT
jgi:SAM-dependent methyltransferase